MRHGRPFADELTWLRNDAENDFPFSATTLRVQTGESTFAVDGSHQLGQSISLQ